MNKFTAALIAIIAVATVGCTGPKNDTPPIVEMSAGTETCFKIDKDLKEAAKAQGLDPNHYHTATCGTESQRIAFEKNEYVVTK